ncbi:MAG: hypothetical protein OXU81_13350, partial [Gammaproteobacteria bacterium]|nr:hypothetical protein [Gammaproteobacteria bacterium]
MSMFPTRGVFLCVVGSHFGEEDNGWASGSLGVAPMASGVGGRRRLIYPEGVIRRFVRRITVGAKSGR